MEELIVNLHMHTHYSDGSGTHSEIARAALKAGLDVVIVTDHNVWVNGLEGYHRSDSHRVLLLIGEEIHDQARDPQKNHLIVLGAERELATFAPDPQRLIDKIQQAGGLSFLAHPVDPPMPEFGEDDISWVSWDVKNYTGIELWNAFSELKTVAKTRLQAYFYAFSPRRMPHGPLPETLQRWDALLNEGRKLVAIGGSDAHALKKHAGPIRRTIFSYDDHFHWVNTHILTPEPLGGNLYSDKRMVYDALAGGHAFVGYDLPAPTRGFRFTAQGRDQTAAMGDEIPALGGVTLQVRLPGYADCRLVKNGQVLRTWSGREVYTYITAEPGVYRVEAYREFLGARRGWIFSNPIYLRG
jgi:hypothetical protein